MVLPVQTTITVLTRNPKLLILNDYSLFFVFSHVLASVIHITSSDNVIGKENEAAWQTMYIYIYKNLWKWDLRGRFMHLLSDGRRNDDDK